MSIVFFDLETTGFPVSWKESYSNISNWPYIVQLAYIVTHENYGISEEHDIILKPSQFIIPSKSTNVHGISNEQATNEGQERKIVLKKFAALLNEADFIVAHNVSFDVNVLRCEFLRNDIEDPFNNNDLNIICTMKESTDYCKIPSGFGHYKWPSLQELHVKLFGNYFEEAHDAKHDVKATFDCFWKLIDLNVVKFDFNSIQKILFDEEYLKSFFVKRSDIFYAVISKHYPLNEELLSLFETKLNWYAVSQNINIDWKIDLIDKFYNKWDFDAENGGYPLGKIKWYGLSSNPKLPWTKELIKKYLDKLAFKDPSSYNKDELSTNPSLPWSHDLIDEFLVKWDWGTLSKSSFLPWSETFIEKYKNKWKWNLLSKNESLPWSISLICKFQHFWDFKSINKMILESTITINSKEVIKAYFEGKISIKNIIYLPLTETFIDLAIDSFKFDWHNFRNYGILPWSSEAIIKYRHKFDGVWGFESNNNFYWTLDLLREFEDILLWNVFSHNENVDFSIDFFIEFEHRIEFDEDKYDPYKISWNKLKENIGIIWTKELIDKYYSVLVYDQKFWTNLSSGLLKINWSDEIINEYYFDLDWRGLSENPNLPWTEEFIREYAHNWSWTSLTSNPSIIWNDSLIKDYIYDFTDNFENIFIIIKLLNNCSDMKFVFDFLENNKTTEYYFLLDKIWESTKQELNDDFVLDIFNSIKNKNILQ